MTTSLRSASTKRRWLRRLIILFAFLASLPPLGITGIIATSYFAPIAPTVPLPTPSLIVEDRHGRPLVAVVNHQDQWHFSEQDNEQRDWLDQALIAVEDHRFDHHSGVDWQAITAALWSNVCGNPRRGASTIAMQVMRLRHQRPRSLTAKWMEAAQALAEQRRLGRSALLREYRSRAPFGGNIVGSEAAAWRWFGCRAADLSLGQAALLAGLPQSPERLRPDRHPLAAGQRRRVVLQRMLAAGMITQQQASSAEREALPRQLQPLPQQIKPWHSEGHSGYLASLLRWHGLSAHGGHRRSTLDYHDLQMLARRLQQGGQDGHDGDSVAAVVINVDDGHLRALYSSGPQQWLDGTARRRSLGSTIKPFIISEAMAQGWLSLDHSADDSPAVFGGWAPGNADNQWSVGYTQGQALAHSRNLSAINILQRAGVQRVAGLARSMGLTAIDGDMAQLSLGVGSALGSAQELASAYATLARDGIYLPTSWLANEPHPSSPEPMAAQPSRILPSGIGHQVLAALASPERTAALNRSAAARQVAWKTGTSSAQRDGWCVAVSPRTVVVVWIGRHDGQPTQNVAGIVAAPLALDLLCALDPPGPGWSVASRVGSAQSTTPPPPRHQPQAPQILVPQNGDVLRGSRQMKAEAWADGPLHWFVNGQHQGVSHPVTRHHGRRIAQHLSLQLRTGMNQIWVVDERGESNRVQLMVRPPNVN